ncbi:MAG: DUF4830 domain-containing protein [Clostridia bacterium]|nr:DUF4830 domain-containing protein [Clostridia bacterium]
MKLYVSLGRGILAAIFAALLVVVMIFGSFSSVLAENKNGSTNKLRVEFAQSIRCEVKEEMISQKKIIIPLHFSEVYENYNALQKKAGFNLSKYKGCEAVVYTYQVLCFGPFGKDDNARLNLIVYNGKIIGGDVSSAAIDGIMLPILRI